MSNWDLGVVTDAGVTLLNKIEAGLATAVIDTIVIGSGVYSSTEKALISRRTALKNQQLSATINKKQFPDASTLEIKASIDNTTVVTGFNITECGVYATVTEGGVDTTILFAISYTESPDYMSAYNGEYPQIVIEDVYLPISNDASISVSITVGAYALAEDLTDLEDKAYKNDDGAETDIADGDSVPFYDLSATANKKITWSNIISKLKNLFSLGSNLAPIANGPKYPASWYIGKKFVYQGQLCKTTANVTTSDDISVGPSGNAQLDSDITSQIRDLSNKAYQTDDATGHGILQGADCSIPYFNVTSNRKEKIGYSSLKGDLIGRPVADGVIERIGETAMESYAKGEYFLANDFYYYVATSAITGGSSTISTGAGGNCSKTSIAAGMNSLTSQISNLNSKFSSQTLINSVPYKCTNANTWEYTGLSFTLSNPCIVLVGVSYTECPVTGILVARSSSNTQHVRFSNENSGIGGMNLLGHYYGDTWYIWVKYNNPGKTNNITAVKIISLN